jgi:hypothetical protein
MKLYYFLLFAFCIFSLTATAQTGNTGAAKQTPQQSGQNNGNAAPNNTTPPVTIVSTPTAPVIGISLDLNNFSGNPLPFDIPFKIAGGGGQNEKITVADLISVDCYYIAQKGAPPPNPLPKTSKERDEAFKAAHWTHLQTWINKGTSNLYWFDVPPLEPNTDYTFSFFYDRMLTPTEKTALVSFAQPLILPELKTMSTGGTFQFDAAGISKITADLIKKMNTHLLAAALHIDQQNVDPANYQKLFKAISTIAFANDIARNDRDNAQKEIETLRHIYDLVSSFIDDYQKNGSDANRQNNLKQLQATKNTIAAVYNLPTSDQAIDPLQSKPFTDACNAVDAAINGVTLNSPDFTLLRRRVTENADDLADAITQYGLDLKKAASVSSDQLGTFIDAVSTALYNELTISDTNVNGDFVTRTSSYVCADLGIALMPGIDKVAPYVGTNIYFRPINTNAHLKWSDEGQFGKRVSLVIGVSVASIARANVRSDLFGNTFNIMTGLGVRLNDWIRISGGALWYSKLDPNPLNTNQQIARTGFVSISFDLRIKTALNNLFTPTQTTQ